MLRPLPIRWLRRLALVLLIVYAAYLLLGNVLLNTALGPGSINQKPEKFQMHWGPALTWWPGRVVLWQVRLKGHVRHNGWTMQAQRASGRIAMLPLLRRELHVPYVVATGVRGGVERVAMDIPPPPRRPGGWTLRFDRIVSDSVSGGKFGDWALDGKGTAQFGFVKQLRGGPVQVLPSSAHFQGVRVTRDGREWLREAEITGQMAMAAHTRDQASGIHKLLMTDAALKLDGATAGIDLSLDDKGKPVVQAVPGAGRIRGELSMQRGDLQPGGHLQWHIPITGTDAGGMPHHNALLDLALAVERGQVRLEAKMPPQADGALALDVRLQVAETRISPEHPEALLAKTSGHVAGQWHFSSLRWFTRLFADVPWLTLEGAGEVIADVAVAEGKLAAGSRISVPDIDVVAKVMGNRVRGRGMADGKLEAGKDGTLRPRMDIRLQAFQVAADDAPGQPYVKGDNLRLEMVADKELAAFRDSLQARLRFVNAGVPDLRAYNRYLPNQHLRFDGGSGTLSGDLSLDAAGNMANGQMRARGRRAQLHAAGMALRGDVDIDMKLRRADLKHYRFDVAGSRIGLSNVSFLDADGDARQGWWGKVDLVATRLDWDRRMSIDGNAQVTMKDVGFLLDMFSRQRDYPDWVYRLVDSGQAQVKGRVRWQGDTLVLDRMQARNERFDIDARLQLRGKQRRGDLYAKWGVLSTGMEVDGDAHKLHLLRARQWYDSRPDLLP